METFRAEARQAQHFAMHDFDDNMGIPRGISSSWRVRRA